MLPHDSLPPAFNQRLKMILPASAYASALESFAVQKPIYARVNTLKTTTEKVWQQLESNFAVTRNDFFPDVLQFQAHQRHALTHSTLVLQGLLYLQAFSSLLPVHILQPQPGEEILDLAAAPGSKTSQLAALMQNQGRIAAVEKVKSRFFRLKANMKTLGASCVDFYLKDGAQVWRHCSDRFDRVLLDAPCSSESRFHLSDPTSYQYWSERKIKEMARKQWRLLYSAFLCLKPGGNLVYSTCSFAPEENEMIIAKLLKTFPEQCQLQPIELALPQTMPGLTTWKGNHLPNHLQNCYRILPTPTTDGFFIAHIRKSSY